MDFSKTLFRCSSLGYIMTEPREKSPLQKYQEAVLNFDKIRSEYDAIENKTTKTAIKKLDQLEKSAKLVEELRSHKDGVHLSATCKTHLIDVYVRQRYGRKTDIQNKYIEKGLAVEEDSITLLSRVRKRFYKKNLEKLSNDWIKGEPDLFTGETIFNAEEITDTKSSWDIFTFMRVLSESVNDKYYWQLHGYMDLSGAKTSTLAYCLINTPEKIIQDELRKLQWQMGIIDPTGNDLFDQAVEELRKNMIYDDIQINERVIEFRINRNDDDILKIHNRVEDCRVWLNEFEKSRTSEIITVA